MASETSKPILSELFAAVVGAVKLGPFRPATPVAGTVGWAVVLECNSESPLPHAWPCRIIDVTSLPGDAPPHVRYLRLSDGGKAALSGADLFVPWNGECEAVLRIAGALAASLISSKSVASFMLALQAGHAGASPSATPLSLPFDTIWVPPPSITSTLPAWPGIVLPLEAATLLCARKTVLSCVRKNEAVVLYMGTPRTLEFDFLPQGSLAGHCFGRDTQLDRSNIAAGRHTLRPSSDADPTFLPSFEVAVRCATLLRRGLADAMKQSAQPLPHSFSPLDDKDDSTVHSCGAGSTGGGVSTEVWSSPAGASASGGAASAGSKRRRRHASADIPEAGASPALAAAAAATAPPAEAASAVRVPAVAAAPSAAAAAAAAVPSRLCDIERELEEVELRRAQLLQAREVAAIQVCPSWSLSWLCRGGHDPGVSRSGCTHYACRVVSPDSVQERRDRAAAAAAAVRGTRESIDALEAAIVTADAAAARARELAERSFTLAVEKATQHRDAAVAQASQELAAVHDASCVGLQPLRAQLEALQSDLATYDDVLHYADGAGEGGQ